MIEPIALLALAMAVPLLASGLILGTERWPRLRDTLVVSGALALLGVVWALFFAFREGARPRLELAEPLPGLALALELEPLGVLFAVVAGTLYAVTAVYAVGYMRANEEHRQGPFHAWFALALAATMGIALSANLFALFLFYEVLTLATWPLVAHHGDEKARKGGRTYLTVLLTSSVGLFLLALVWTWQAAGTLAFTPGGILAGRVEGLSLALLLGLYLFGVGKAAVMPVHRWLPAAMVAPTPVSALLHAVAVVKAGVFTLLKIVVYIFGAEWLLSQPPASWGVYVAAFTVVAASVVALRQDDLKRRLAYSTVSQLGYVVMAALVLVPISLVGAALHIAAHAVGKITLFFAAGAIHTAAHKTRVSELGGIGWRMPWTLGAFAVASLSLVGVPPTVGFLSKWYMLLGAWEAALWTVLAVLTASTLLNTAYFLPIVHAAFFRKEEPVHGEVPHHGEAPAMVVAPLVLTAALTVVLFLFPGLPLTLAQAMAGMAP